MAELRGLIINDTGSVRIPTGNTGTRASVTNPTVESFTSVGTTSWTCPAGVSKVEVLVVGGGGGGASRHGGGGGAGGLIYKTDYPVVAGNTYTVTVGGGGAGAAVGGGLGSNGGNSVFDSLVAIGGGGGTSNSDGNPLNYFASIGGSGGGGRGNSPNLGAPGTPGQGHNGGRGRLQYANTNPEGVAGGGGGAGGPGYSGEYAGKFRGAGGPGIELAISGTPTYYAGGGGGGGAGSLGIEGGGGGYGGIGGGGNGNIGTADNSTAGVNGTGGGGGGGGHNDDAGGNFAGKSGGSGIVILRYTTDADSDESQIRFNTDTESSEGYSVQKWNPQSKTKDIVKNGLWLHLDASAYSTGTVRDLSGNGNDGSLVNGVGTSTEYGGAWTFDGSDDYINIPSSKTFSDEITVECWYKGTKTTRNHLWNLGSGSTTNLQMDFNDGSYDLWMYWNGSGSNRVRYHVGANTDNAFFTDSKVHHIVFVHKGRTNLIYWDGALIKHDESGGTQTFGTIGNADIRLGGDPQAFGGSIYDFKIYTRALTDSEVLQNYNAQAPRFEKGVETPANSALELKRRGVINSGTYLIKTDHGYLRTYCDMNAIDGGGWTLIGKSGGGSWNAPDVWLKQPARSTRMFDNRRLLTNEYACIDARLVAGLHATEVCISDYKMERWVKCRLHSQCTDTTIFNHAFGPTTITNATNESYNAVSWKGDTTLSYVNPYSIMGVTSHGGSTPSWTLNTAGNTNVNEYAMAVACATSDHNGFTCSGNHNGMDAPYNDGQWPNGSYNSGMFYGLVWVR